MTGRFGRCLQMQVDEDIRMQECEAGGGVVLSRNEYFTPISVHPLFMQLWMRKKFAPVCFDCVGCWAAFLAAECYMRKSEIITETK